MSATSAEIAAHPEVFRPHAAQLKGMAEHLGHAHLLFDMGLTDQAKAEMQLVQAQLRYLAGVEQAIEDMGATR